MRPRHIIGHACLTGILIFAAAASSAAPKKPGGEDPLERASERFVKAGYQFREDFWKSTLERKTGRGVRMQLFKGHEYVFILAASDKKARFRLRVADRDGKVAELGIDDTTGIPAYRFVPERTGMHIILILLEKSGKRNVECAMLCGYR